MQCVECDTQDPVLLCSSSVKRLTSASRANVHNIHPIFFRKGVPCFSWKRKAWFPHVSLVYCRISASNVEDVLPGFERLLELLGSIADQVFGQVRLASVVLGTNL